MLVNRVVIVFLYSQLTSVPLLSLEARSIRIHPHSLRHTHTSLLAEAGVDLIRIMERLGHVDDDTTKKIYLYVTKTRKKRPLKSLETS
jgi:integrase